MKTTSEHVLKWRANHHAALESLALEVGCKTDGITLWRKLNRLERKLDVACVRYCSDSSYGIAGWERDKAAAWVELTKIFGGKLPAGIVINSDPRGWILKLDSEKREIPAGMHKDWGQDGILGAVIED